MGAVTVVFGDDCPMIVAAADNAPNAADWVVAGSAIFTAALTLLLVVSAFKAWGTARETLAASREASEAARLSAEAAIRANEQAQLDSIARTRPYVYAHVVPSLAGVGFLDLVVMNSGQSAARDLTLTYDSWPEPADDVTESLQTMFATPRTLAPGCSLRVLWRLEAGEGRRFDEGDPKKAGIDSDGTVGVRYTSGDPSHPPYEDDFLLLFDKSGYWPVPEEGAEPGKAFKDHPELKAFYQLGRALLRRVGELGR